MEPSPTHKRAVVLMFFLFLWAALVAARLFYFTVPGRSEYIAAGERLSIRTGRIPALRGRIISASGELLAWSEIHTSLCLAAVPRATKRRERLAASLNGYVPNFSLENATPGLVLKEDLSPDEQLALYPIASRFPELLLKTEERRCVSDIFPPERLGKVADDDGLLVGVSGYEKRYDETLRGQDGEFRVMVDRRGRWIPGTWRETVKPRNGADVVVYPDGALKGAETRNKKPRMNTD